MIRRLLFNTQYFARTKTFITFTRTRILDDMQNTMLNTINYYDSKGRVIQTIADNHLGGIDRVCTRYGFDGRVLTTLHFHNIPGVLKITGTIFEYDHAGRLVNTWEQTGYFGQADPRFSDTAPSAQKFLMNVYSTSF